MTDVKAELLHLELAENIIAALSEEIPALDAYSEEEIAAFETIVAQNILSVFPLTRAESQPALPEGVEAVAWRFIDPADGQWAATANPKMRDYWSDLLGGVQPLYATPLPTGRGLDEVREAVERELHSLDCALGQLMKCETAPDWVAYRNKVQKHRANIESILASLGGVDKGALRPSAFVPTEGHGTAVLVPKEPTEAMLNAGVDVDPFQLDESEASAIYRAMLAAAPTPPASQDRCGVNQNPEESQ